MFIYWASGEEFWICTIDDSGIEHCANQEGEIETCQNDLYDASKFSCTLKGVTLPCRREIPSSRVICTYPNGCRNECDTTMNSRDCFVSCDAICNFEKLFVIISTILCGGKICPKVLNSQQIKKKEFSKAHFVKKIKRYLILAGGK